MTGLCEWQGPSVYRQTRNGGGHGAILENLGAWDTHSRHREGLARAGVECVRQGCGGNREHMVGPQCARRIQSELHGGAWAWDAGGAALA